MRRAILIALPLVLVISALVYFFVISPTNEEIEVARIDLETEEVEEQALRQRLTVLQRVNERLPEYDRANANMLLSIPANPQIDAITDELTALADRANVVWTQVSFSTPGEETPSGYREIGISLAVEGQYFELLGYLYGMSDLDRLIRINSVDLSPSIDEETGINIMSLTLNAVAFTTGDIVIPEAPVVEDPDIPVDEETTTTTVLDEATTTTTEGG